MKGRSSSAMVIAILMALLIGYIGGYFALVNPEAGYSGRTEVSEGCPIPTQITYYDGYRNGGNWASKLFWPLEQIDRRVRPKAWPP